MHLHCGAIPPVGAKIQFNMEPKKQLRDSNLELLRIVAMLAIIASHYGFWLTEAIKNDPVSSRTIFFTFFTCWGKLGINVFMLISGYFMCNKDTNLYKWLKLLLQIYFYNIIIGGVFFATGYAPLTIGNIVEYVFPFRLNSIDYFTTSFLWFYLFIPFFNIISKNLSHQQHRTLLLLSFGMHLLYGNIPSFKIPLDAVLWYGMIFLLASYIRKYDLNFFSNSSKKWGWATIILTVMAIVEVAGLAFLGQKLGKSTSFGVGFIRYGNSFFAVTIAVSLFMWLKSIHIPYNKYINILGGGNFWCPFNTQQLRCDANMVMATRGSQC